MNSELIESFGGNDFIPPNVTKTLTKNHTINFPLEPFMPRQNMWMMMVN